ncbi:caM kinase-like vesicle-associated protein [Chanos chanos]|uniref:non-specific serine/threonine protein kinase n=1 Tax=Chanos chanos TaxID=29144 RepID=A0A6J2WLA6_CHACN|nr:serine/threonine-protein kinase DCLK3 [Chanos chanos]
MTPAWNQRLVHEPARPKWRLADQRITLPKCPNVPSRQPLASYTTGSRTLGRTEAWRPLQKAVIGPCGWEESGVPKGSGFHARHAEESPVRPRVVTVVRPCGERCLRKISLLLNRRAVQTFEQLLADVSEALGFPRWNNARVRRLFSPAGREIRSLSDFFRSDHAFLALGPGRPTLSDIQAAVEELYPNSPRHCDNLLRLWERVLRPKAAKADSGFHDDDPQVEKPPDAGSDPPASKPHANNLQPIRGQGRQRGRGKEEGPRGDVERRQKKDASPRLEEKEEVREEVSVYCRNCKGCKPVPPIAENNRHQWEEPDKRSIKAPSVKESRTLTEKMLNKQLEMDQHIVKHDFGLSSPLTESNRCVTSENPKQGVFRQEVTKPEVTKHKDTVPELLPDGAEVTPDDIARCYDMGGVVGDGNFAVVRECRVRGSAGTFAMKVVDKAKLQGRAHMIQNEIALLRSLAHPRLVRLLASHHTHSHVYLLMELVAGGDLFDAIAQNGRFCESTAGRMIRDISQALEYIHSKSIAHRDIKPENLLVQRHGDGSVNLKLADFGLAMVVTEPVFTVCGTPTYVAPEILAETGYGVEVDVWAMGVILFVLLCGFPPFRSPDRDQDELFRLIRSGEVHFISPYWDPVSEGAKALVRALLEVDPRVRLTAHQALQHNWLQHTVALDDQQGEMQTIQDQREKHRPVKPVEADSNQQRAERPVDNRIDQSRSQGLAKTSKINTVQQLTPGPLQSSTDQTAVKTQKNSHDKNREEARNRDQPSTERLAQTNTDQRCQYRPDRPAQTSTDQQKQGEPADISPGQTNKYRPTESRNHIREQHGPERPATETETDTNQTNQQKAETPGYIRETSIDQQIHQREQDRPGYVRETSIDQQIHQRDQDRPGYTRETSTDRQIQKRLIHTSSNERDQQRPTQTSNQNSEQHSP